MGDGEGGGGAKAEKAQLTMSSLTVWSTSELGAQHPLGPTASQLPHRFSSCIGMWDGLMKSGYDPGSGPGVQVGQPLKSDVAEVGLEKYINTGLAKNSSRMCGERGGAKDRTLMTSGVQGAGRDARRPGGHC